MARQPTLIRSLGLSDATLLIVGCIVGVGIFRTASSIAGYLPSAPLILLIWVFGGLLSLCGALCYAELAAMFPASGGDYVYITKVYGRFWGFLFGWTKLFIERTGTIAILGVVFAEYFGGVLLYGTEMTRWVAACAILFLTGVNVVGIRWGKYVQNVFTVLKIAALLAIIYAGISATAGTQHVFAWKVLPDNLPLIQSLGMALLFVIWTFGGWTEAAYVAEEVKDPTRNIPRAILIGVVLVTVLYLGVNGTYLLLVPVETLANTPLIASYVMQSTLGYTGAIVIAWMVSCSAFGALNGYILTGGRILYAIGKEHALFGRLGVVHPSFHTPALALWTNAVIAIGLVFTKTFDQMVTYSTVVISVFFIMAVFALIILRRTEPKLPRPYRAFGYPLTPLIFILTLIGLIVIVSVQEPAEAVFGFGLLALGLPLYWISERIR